MPLAPYSNIPGRPGYTFWLPSDIDVDTRVVNHSRVRSYQTFTGHQYTTVHDTGNATTTAEGEYSWLAGGRNGGSMGGYNAITDADQIILTGMFNEVTWHAGTADGNRTSFGVEMAFGGGQRWDRVLDVNVALHGAICAAFGWDPARAAVLHQKWYGKYCSAQILNRRIWQQVQAAIAVATTNARAAASGQGQPVPSPVKYAPVVPIKALDDALAALGNPDDPSSTVAPHTVLDPVSGVRFFWVGDRVRAIRDTPRRQFAYEGSPDVGGIIKRGTEFDVDWAFVAGDDRPYYLTSYNTRVLMDDTERILDAKLG